MIGQLNTLLEQLDALQAGPCNRAITRPIGNLNEIGTHTYYGRKRD